MHRRRDRSKAKKSRLKKIGAEQRRENRRKRREDWKRHRQKQIGEDLCKAEKKRDDMIEAELRRKRHGMFGVVQRKA